MPLGRPKPHFIHPPCTRSRRRHYTCAALFLIGCANAPTASDGAGSAVVQARLASEIDPPERDYAVGTLRVSMDVSEGRRLPVQLWYPAIESARSEAWAGRPMLDLEPPGPDRELLERMIRDAPDSYTPRAMHAADAPEPLEAEAPFPLVLISHCTDCLRIGYYSVAEQLAARGFVVAAPDHVQNTLYDVERGTSVGLDLEGFLERRRLDMLQVTDILLNPSAVVVPAGLRGRIDAERVGMAGHSFGAITTSYASTRDPRIRAVAFLAMAASEGDNLPVLGEMLAESVEPVRLSRPSFFLLAMEDMGDIGGLNDLIRQNFEDYPAESWLATLRDAGHYSVTDICGITSVYANGCGAGIRVTEFLQPFTFLDIGTAMDLTGALVTAFFEQQLMGASAEALEGVARGAPGVLDIEHRTQ
jgi:dienelactone hydrolase